VVRLGLIKNKAGDRPRPNAKTSLTPIYLFFQLYLLKLHLNDSVFSLGLVLKCLLSTKLLLVFNQILFII